MPIMILHKKFRHEFKYVCTESKIVMMQQRISGIMPLDKHVGEQGQYTVRNIYFDDVYNTCYFDNLDGNDLREKFRIRIYNQNPDRIRLEIKRKERSKTEKHSCALTLEQCYNLMNGNMMHFSQNDDFVLKRLLMLMKTRHMTPKIIVEYERIPYVYAHGNVRVTFDKNISSSSDIGGFLNNNIHKRPIMPVGHHVLEVKYDEYLPDFISSALQIENHQQTAFSKYSLCRKYNLGGWQ